ncbi:hypothetical protein GQR58_020207 [Nymphon striatum]|nr:hypothetical protein GQR58_024659 [Nymphon striatum]KAG1663796.1 hypothetical protein GQR58_020207 [Nymphon striatum]
MTAMPHCNISCPAACICGQETDLGSIVPRHTQQRHLYNNCLRVDGDIYGVVKRPSSTSHTHRMVVRRQTSYFHSHGTWYDTCSVSWSQRDCIPSVPIGDVS